MGQIWVHRGACEVLQVSKNVPWGSGTYAGMHKGYANGDPWIRGMECMRRVVWIREGTWGMTWVKKGVLGRCKKHCINWGGHAWRGSALIVIILKLITNHDHAQQSSENVTQTSLHWGWILLVHRYYFEIDSWIIIHSLEIQAIGFTPKYIFVCLLSATICNREHTLMHSPSNLNLNFARF